MAMMKEFIISMYKKVKDALIDGTAVRRGGEEWDALIDQLLAIEGELRISRGEKLMIERVRDMILRAEDLTAVHMMIEMQKKVAPFKTPIYSIRMCIISRQLHTLLKQIPSEFRELAANQRRPPQLIPLHLKRCLYYLALFPPDFQIPARRLLALWVAEGLVVHSNNLLLRNEYHEDAEQIAQSYLEELIDLDVLNVTRNNLSGKVKTCSIHRYRRRDLLDEAWGEYFLRDSNGNARSLVDMVGASANSDPPMFIEITGPHSIAFKRVCADIFSFSSFNTEEGSKPGDAIGDFLRKCISAGYFIRLRVLDLEQVFRPKLPDTLGKLILLRYLGLRWTYLEQLPNSVDKLLNLQVLDVKHTYITVLPRSIWRMQHLRHLYLSETYRTKFPDPPSGVITLTGLQTLWGAFVDVDTRVVGGLDRLLNVRKLGLSCRSKAYQVDRMSKQLEAIGRWISKLECLETLRLKSRDECNNAADLRLTSLASNCRLSTLYLFGRLDRDILCRGQLPASLTNVTLSGSELDLDPLEFLGDLPELVALQLLGQSVVSRKIRCCKTGFPKLKLLWIWKLEKLEEFEVEEGSLPCLQELEVRFCPNLKTLPQQLRHIQDLEITLTGMPLELLQSQIEHIPIRDLHRRSQENGIYCLKFNSSPLNYSSIPQELVLMN